MGVVSCGTTMLDQGVFQNIGAVTWDTTAKTAGFTAVSGNGYFVNTTSGTITVTLPASPSAGDIVSIADYTNTFQTNAVTVARNGSNIGGVAANATLSTEGQSVTFVYVDGTEGWKNVQDSTSNIVGNLFMSATGGTITTCGNCKIHTFTGPGTFCVSSTAFCAANNEVSYMVVAGGAGGGRGCSGAGGGAGGFREDKSPVTPYTASPLDGAGPITVTATAFPIIVGAGGAGSSPGDTGLSGTAGSNSVFSTITSAGGGSGGGDTAGGNGGSGGGGGHNAQAGGTGNTPPVSPPQGNNGANSQPLTGPAPSDAGGAGGGATAVGTPGSTNHTGGAGATTSISGTPTAYAGGGGGSNRCGGDANDVAGGSGGGGRGSFGPRPTPVPEAAGVAGTANTGGGGGGGKRQCSTGPIRGGGGAGGSGIVIIRYRYQ